MSNKRERIGHQHLRRHWAKNEPSYQSRCARCLLGLRKRRCWAMWHHPRGRYCNYKTWGRSLSDSKEYEVHPRKCWHYCYCHLLQNPYHPKVKELVEAMEPKCLGRLQMPYHPLSAMRRRLRKRNQNQNLLASSLSITLTSTKIAKNIIALFRESIFVDGMANVART